MRTWTFIAPPCVSSVNERRLCRSPGVMQSAAATTAASLIGLVLEEPTSALRHLTDKKTNTRKRLFWYDAGKTETMADSVRITLCPSGTSSHQTTEGQALDFHSDCSGSYFPTSSAYDRRRPLLLGFFFFIFFGFFFGFFCNCNGRMGDVFLLLRVRVEDSENGLSRLSNKDKMSFAFSILDLV